MFQCGPYRPVPAIPHLSSTTDTIASSLSEQVARIDSTLRNNSDNNNSNNNVDDDGKYTVDTLVLNSLK